LKFPTPLSSFQRILQRDRVIVVSGLGIFDI
jgi:hypothetical protein